MIMWALICLKQNPPHIDYLGDGPEYELKVRPKLPEDHDYSDDLIDLIDRCIQYYPAQRPKPHELVRAIEKEFEGEG